MTTVVSRGTESRETEGPAVLVASLPGLGIAAPGAAQLAASDLAALLGDRGVSTSAVTRLAYGRDAYPIAIRQTLRSGPRFEPDLVAWPTTTDEVAAVLRVAAQRGLAVVPYGAGSGIVGGALAGPATIVLDLKRLARFVALDPVSMTATVEAGMLGKDFEDRLNAEGFTCGHYPQSLFSSTVGGWVSHRGVGTFSTRYGKIDDLVLGMEAVLADGTVVRSKPVPQSAAGPDLKRLFLGSEGTLGVVTEVTLQIFPLPEARRLLGFACPSFDAGLDAVRRMVQAGYRPAAVRLYDPVEAGERLGLDPQSPDSLLIAVVEGPGELADATARAFEATATMLGLRSVGGGYAEQWLASRFNTAGLVSTNESATGVADALEVANTWSRLGETYRQMKAAMEAVAGAGGRVYGHASHFYHAGGNLYMIFHANADDPALVEDRYQLMLRAAFDACLATGGTLTHHHGVGIGKREFMPSELGSGGHELLARIKAAVDPDGVLNPGKLIEGAR